MGTHTQKKALRRQMRALRRARSEVQRLEASRAVTHHLRAAAPLAGAEVVALYWALPEELVLWPGVVAPVIALPVMQGAGRALAFRALTHPDDLVPATFGVLEPPVGAPAVELSRIDVMVLPGLAIDPAGNRLGYGGGYYDRTLAGLRTDAVTVMVALDEQVLDAVPTDASDVRVQAVVTPSGWRWLTDTPSGPTDHVS